MYPNLFRELDLPKFCDIPKPSDILSQVEGK